MSWATLFVAVFVFCSLLSVCFVVFVCSIVLFVCWQTKPFSWLRVYGSSRLHHFAKAKRQFISKAQSMAAPRSMIFQRLQANSYRLHAHTNVYGCVYGYVYGLFMDVCMDVFMDVCIVGSYIRTHQ